MGQPKHLRTVELDLQQLVRICRPSTRWVRIAWGVGFHIDKAAIVRCGNVHRETPIERCEAGLLSVGKPDLYDAVVADRLRVIGIGPHQNFIAIGVQSDVLVAIGTANLPQEVHVGIKQLLASVADGSALNPGNNHIIVGRDIEAIETVPTRIKYGRFRVGTDPILEDVPAVPGENKVVPIEKDVGFALAANGAVFAERGHDVYGAAGDVIALELVAVNVVNCAIILPRPPRLAGGVDLERKIPNIEAGSIIESEIALVHQKNLGIVAVERAHGRILVLDPRQVAAAVGVWRAQGVRYPLDGRAEDRIHIGAAHRRRLESIVVGWNLHASGRQLRKSWRHRAWQYECPQKQNGLNELLFQRGSPFGLKRGLLGRRKRLVQQCSLIPGVNEPRTLRYGAGRSQEMAGQLLIFQK